LALGSLGSSLSPVAVSDIPQPPPPGHTPVSAEPYPLAFDVVYPDRDLERVTTGLRTFTVIPIAIVLAAVQRSYGWGGSTFGVGSAGRCSSPCR